MMDTKKRFAVRSARHIMVLLPIAAALSMAPTWAQDTKAASPPPAAPPGPAKKAGATGGGTSFTLSFARPGSYQCYPLLKGSKGEGIAPDSGKSTVAVELPSGSEGVEVLDEVTGLVSVVPMSKIKAGATVTVKPEEFNRLQTVLVELHSKNGQPAAKGVVTLTPAGGKAIQYGLTAADNGVARFNDVPLGKAQVLGYVNAGQDEIQQSATIAPAVGGKAQTIALTLPVDVKTVNAAPAGGAVGTTAAPGSTPANGTAPTIVVNTGEKKEEKNDWASGLVGLAVIAVGVFFGLRYLKQRGMTPKEAIADAMQQLGVDSPGAPVPGSAHSGLRPSTPDVVQSPLPSLSDLPSAGAAAKSVNAGSVPMNGPHLVGVAGSVMGRNFALSTGLPLTMGRDPQTSVPLAQDSAVSRRHASVQSNGAGWDLVDESSTNGTFVNGKRVESRIPLSPGDEIQVGTARFRFEG